MIRSWCSLSREGQSGAENGIVKFRCRPQSIPRSLARSAALLESFMNAIALVDETAPMVTHSRIRSVVLISRPQSSALMISALGLRSRLVNPISPWLPGKGEFSAGVGFEVTTTKPYSAARGPIGDSEDRGRFAVELAPPRQKNFFNRCICSRLWKATNSCDTG